MGWPKAKDQRFVEYQWKRVAARLSSSPRRAPLPDVLTLLLVGILACVAFTAAMPRVASADSAVDAAVFIDDGAAALLERKGIKGESALALDQVSRFVDTSRHVVDPRKVIDKEVVEAWAASRSEEHLFFVSPRDFGDLPGRVQVFSFGADPLSLPFTYLRVGDGWLYARMTQAGAQLEVATVDGQTLKEVSASGFEDREVLVELPQVNENLELRLKGAREGRDRAYLLYQAPIKLSFSGVPDEVAQALQSAFPGGIQVAGEDSDCAVIFGERPNGLSQNNPAIRQVSRSELKALDEGKAYRTVWHSDSTLMFDMPKGWLDKSSIRHALEASENLQIILGLADGDERIWPLVAYDPQNNEIRTSLDLFGRLNERAWLPLFIASTCERLTGRSPLKEERFTANSYNDQSAGKLLNPLEALTSAKPTPGLYEHGVVNALAPPPSQVWKQDVLPSTDLPTSLFSNQFLRWPFILGACVLLGLACTLLVLNLERGLAKSRS